MLRSFYLAPVGRISQPLPLAVIYPSKPIQRWATKPVVFGLLPCVLFRLSLSLVWLLSLARLSVSGGSLTARSLGSWLRCGSRRCRLGLRLAGLRWLAIPFWCAVRRRGRVGLRCRFPVRCLTGLRVWGLLLVGRGCGCASSGLLGGFGSPFFGRVPECWKLGKSVVSERRTVLHLVGVAPLFSRATFTQRPAPLRYAPRIQKNSQAGVLWLLAKSAIATSIQLQLVEASMVPLSDGAVQPPESQL